MPACPSELELEAYLDVGPAVGIDAHLADCGRCRGRLAAMRRDHAFLDECRTVRRRAAEREAGGFPDAPPGYQLVRVIGRGGQAIVYEALQTSTQRRVALKVVRLGTRDIARRRRRFEREIELVSSLRHPSLVTIFDSGMTPDGDPYLVMELVDGEPIGFRPGISPHQRLRTFLQVCGAIRHAHRHGVVHRDIKPSNILVDRAGTPRVLDFGLATTVEARDTLTLTRSGEFLGTPIYAAPEQLRGEGAVADVRTDVYALGVLLYQLLTGEHPYAPGSALADIVSDILERDPVRPSSRAGGLNHEIDTIVLKALAKEPQRRYPSVDALHADLERYLRGEPIEAKRDSTWYVLRKAARRHRWVVAAIAGFLLMTISFAIVMAVLYRSAREVSRELQVALATRDLERGIELARAGDYRAAEPLLWAEYDVPFGQPRKVADWAEFPLLHRRAHWALWELYQEQPCFATAHLGDKPWGIYADADEAVLIPAGSQVVRWKPGGGPPERVFGPLNDAGHIQTVHVDSRRDWVMVLENRRVRVFHLADGTVRLDRPVPADPPPLTWSEPAERAAGLSIASAHAGGFLRIWNLETGDVGPLLPVPIETHSVSLLADGRVWLTPSRLGQRFGMYDLASGVGSLSREVISGSWLSVGADGRFVHSQTIWSGHEETRGPSLEDDPRARVNSYRFSESGRKLVGRGPATPIWDSRTGSLEWVLATRDCGQAYLAADDRTLVTAHADGTIRAWDLRREPAASVIAVDETAHCVAFEPDSGLLAIAGATLGVDGFLAVRAPAAAGGAIESVDLSGLHVETLAGLAWIDKTALLTGCHGGRVARWTRSGGRWSGELLADLGEAVNCIAVAEDRRTFAIAVNDGRVLRGTAAGGLSEVGRHRARVATVAWLPDGTLVSGGVDGQLLRWRGGTGEPVLASKQPVRVVRAHRETGWMAAGGDDQVIRVWDGRGRLRHQLVNGSRVFALAFSPDGTLLATGDASGGVRLWDVPTGVLLANLRGHEHMIFSLAFNEDGEQLASGASDRTVRVWDLRWYERHIRGNLPEPRAD